MSHPDPRHDAENERADDDLLRQEDDARRRALEDSRKSPECEDRCQILEHKGYHICSQTGRCEIFEQDKVNAYADYHIKREQIAPAYNTATDTAPDGRNIASWNRRIIAPQQQQIIDIARRAKERRK